MPQWNQQEFNSGEFNSNQTVISPPFDEIYLRNYIVDEGQCDESIGQIYTVDSFTVAAGQLQFNLGKAPNNQFPVFVYHNQLLCNPIRDYTINGQQINFADSILTIGDNITCCYWIPLP